MMFITHYHGRSRRHKKASDYDIDEEEILSPSYCIAVIAKLPDGNSIKLTTNQGLYLKQPEKNPVVLKAKKGGKN